MAVCMGYLCNLPICYVVQLLVPLKKFLLVRPHAIHEVKDVFCGVLDAWVSHVLYGKLPTTPPLGEAVASLAKIQSSYSQYRQVVGTLLVVLFLSLVFRYFCQSSFALTWHWEQVWE